MQLEFYTTGDEEIYGEDGELLTISHIWMRSPDYPDIPADYVGNLYESGGNAELSVLISALEPFIRKEWESGKIHA